MKTKAISQKFLKKNFGKKVIAVLLSMLIMVSIFIVGSITAVAEKSNTSFQHNETIYIDATAIPTWTDLSAITKAYFYYSDNSNFNVAEQNNCNYSEELFTNPTMVAKSTLAEEVSKGVYKVNVPNGTSGYIQVIRVNPTTGTVWNKTLRVCVDTRTAGQNCVALTNWNVDTKWTTASYTPTISGGEYDAIPDASITQNKSLYQVKASFFDYYCDDEIRNGWRKIDYSSTHGDWEPYQTLNRYIGENATANGSWLYPEYFGNFFDKNDGYAGVGNSKMVRFKNIVNNSARLGGYNKSVVGLTDQTLTANKELSMFGNTVSPYFSKDWLKNNKLATIVNTKFPMRITTDKFNNPYYEFDSGNAKDNVWFGNYANIGNENLSISYGSGTKYGMKDALDSYSTPIQPCGYGFFPFDATKENGGAREDNRALNFGFGMRVDIDFNVSQNGLLNGHPEQFTFTGDDDVWVFIDGVLVLDLGGDHKQASGIIDFSNLTSTVSTGTTSVTPVTRNGAFPELFGVDGKSKFSNTTPQEKHTLTMFYMERGMVESNLKFGFNFSPVGNEFISEKVVNTADVNEGIKDAVAKADKFDFTHSNNATTPGNYNPSSGKQYSYYNGDTTSILTTPTTGNYKLGNAEKAIFADQFKTGSYFKVEENTAANLSYTTKWQAEDLVLKEKGAAQYIIGTGVGATSEFRFLTLNNVSELNPTNIKLTYTNTPTVAPVTITKSLTDFDNTDLNGKDTTKFNINTYVSLDGGTSYNTYPLNYTISGDATVYAMTNAGKLNSNALLEGGKTITIIGVPVNAIVKIVEDASAGYKYVSTTGTNVSAVTGGGLVTVPSSGAAFTVNNQKNPPDSTSIKLAATKTLDGTAPKDGSFSFLLKDKDNNKDLQIKTNIGKDVSFDELTYTKVGTYNYSVSETNLSDKIIKYDTTVYEITVVVERQANNKLKATPTYKKIVGANKIDVTDMSFANTTKTVEVTLHKREKGSVESQEKYCLKDCVLELRAAKKDAKGNWVDDTASSFIPQSKTTGTNGEVTFNKVPLGEYLVYEMKAPVGYELSKVPMHISLNKNTVINNSATGVLTFFAFVDDLTTQNLPYTGGIGITIFVVIGVLLIGTAVFLLIKSKKKRK